MSKKNLNEEKNEFLSQRPRQKMNKKTVALVFQMFQWDVIFLKFILFYLEPNPQYGYKTHVGTKSVPVLIMNKLRCSIL
jgi:hypothetical protein